MYRLQIARDIDLVKVTNNQIKKRRWSVLYIMIWNHQTHGWVMKCTYGEEKARHLKHRKRDYHQGGHQGVPGEGSRASSNWLVVIMSVRIIRHCDHILGSSAYVHISGSSRILGEQPRYNNRRMYINGEGGLLVSFHIQVVRAHDDD